MEGYAEIGIQEVVAMPMGPDPAGWVSTVTENVLPRLRGL
jgi:hypothetical protein